MKETQKGCSLYMRLEFPPWVSAIAKGRKNHRGIESFELEGIFKGHLAQPPATNRNTYTGSGAQSPVQPDLGCLHGAPTSLGTLCQCFRGPSIPIPPLSRIRQFLALSCRPRPIATSRFLLSLRDRGWLLYSPSPIFIFPYQYDKREITVLLLPQKRFFEHFICSLPIFWCFFFPLVCVCEVGQ